MLLVVGKKYTQTKASCTFTLQNELINTYSLTTSLRGSCDLQTRSCGSEALNSLITALETVRFGGSHRYFYKAHKES